MDSRPVAQESCHWHIAAVGHHGGVTFDPLKFDSYEGAVAAKGRLRSIGYTSGDGAMVVHQGKHDVCKYLDVEIPSETQACLVILD